MIARTTHSPKLDYWQNAGLDSIEPYTEGYVVTVTRGHSLPIEQLNTIHKYAIANFDLAQFPEYEKGNLTDRTTLEDGTEVYLWQRVWSELLRIFSATNGKKGAKINPPLAAVCLFDYIVNNVNKKGQIISPSPHIGDVNESPKVKPRPIDFSQKIVNESTGEKTANIDLVASFMNEAKTNEVPIRNVTVEYANGCVHIDLMKEPI